MNCFEALQSLRAEIQEETAAAFGDTNLLNFLNEGARQVALRAHPVEKEIVFEPTTGVREYPIRRVIPDLMGIRFITYKNRPMTLLTDKDEAAFADASCCRVTSCASLSEAFCAAAEKRPCSETIAATFAFCESTASEICSCAFAARSAAISLAL